MCVTVELVSSVSTNIEFVEKPAETQTAYPAS